MNILIIEDDADINEVVATFLGKHGFVCTQAFSGSEAKLVLGAQASLASSPFDLIITDLMLPGVSGQDLVDIVRAQSTTPIIVISAQAVPSGKVELLSRGADDYLVKPFDLDELLARIMVQLRHMNTGSHVREGSTESIISFKQWQLDQQARCLTAAEVPIKLTRLEYNILEALMSYPKKVFTKQELFEAAWNEECFIEEKAINVHMSNIRAKLKETGTDTYIETVWGIGFKLA